MCRDALLPSLRVHPSGGVHTPNPSGEKSITLVGIPPPPNTIKAEAALLKEMLDPLFSLVDSVKAKASGEMR